MRTPEDELATLSEEGLLRSLRRMELGQLIDANSDGHKVINFSSNDYLGLSRDEALVNAACEATRRHGAGSGAE